MIHSKVRLILHGVSLIALFAILLIMILALISPRPTQALPEYAQRTHEPCATCHVSPGGGGPRTMRGLLWIADGRPDQVRVFEGILLAPGVNDPQVLYDRACAACHGSKGEGGAMAVLVGFDFSKSLIRRKILQGAPSFGMPNFQGQFSDEQLDALVSYVSDLTSGRLVPPDSYPLPPGELGCSSSDIQPGCGGN
jgi:Cytochrome C oxidase, cbb3-type, subunit III